MHYKIAEAQTYKVRETTHSWTDATVSQQLATILTDAYDNVPRQTVEPELVVLGPVCSTTFCCHCDWDWWTGYTTARLYQMLLDGQVLRAAR